VPAKEVIPYPTMLVRNAEKATEKRVGHSKIEARVNIWAGGVTIDLCTEQYDQSNHKTNTTHFKTKDCMDFKESVSVTK
jgi:hypothetical protein